MIFFIFSGALAAQAVSTQYLDDLNNFKNKSLTLQTERQNLESASDILLSKKLFWTPKLSLSAHEVQTKINSENYSDVNYLAADLSLNLFRGGSDLNSLSAASAQRKAQELQVLNESLNVEVKASDLIFKSLYLAETVRIQEQFLKLKEESLKILKDRYSQGKLPLQEVTKSEVDLTQQKSKFRSANLDQVENKSQIVSYFVDEVQTKDWPFDESTTVSNSSTVILPLVQQKYWASQSREETWRSIKGEHWPSLDLHLQYQEASIKERQNNQLVGMISLTLPIWNRFETSAQVSTAYSEYLNSLNLYKDTDQSLKQKNSFLREKMNTTRLNLTEAKRNLQAARKLYQDILKSFRIGRMSTNDLLLEQNRLLESENSLALSQLTFHQSLIETCALSGLNAANCLR